MVPILAKQAVIIKCCADTDTGIILGEYECAYAIGLLAHFAGIALPEQMNHLSELQQYVLEQSRRYKPADGRQKQLVKMLAGYKAGTELDEQMIELIHTGYEEVKEWTR